MMTVISSPRWLALVLLSLAAVGCSQSEYGDMGKVSGVVSLDGNPYPNAQVRFIPESGRPSIGVTDNSGKYELLFIRDVRGAKPGKYKVDITTVPPTLSDTEGAPEPPEVLPPKYNRSTELEKLVEAGNNRIDFELTSR